MEEERGTGGNRGKKRREERGRKVPASMPPVSERGHIVKRVAPVSAATKCFCSSVAAGADRAPACGAMEWDFSASHTGGPPARRGGRGPTSGGMPRGPAERDGKRSRSFPRSYKLPGFLFSMGRVMEVETLNFL